MAQNSNDLAEGKKASTLDALKDIGRFILYATLYISIAGFTISLESIKEARQKRLNDLEDTTAIASVGMITNYYGQVVNKTPFGEGIDGYVAFDKSDDCKIDLIKEYGIKMASSGGRAGRYPKQYINRYPLGDKKFETLREKYFSQCAHLPPPKKIKGLK